MAWACDKEDYGDPVLHPNGVGIPACMVSRDDGQALAAAVAAGTVNLGFDQVSC